MKKLLLLAAAVLALSTLPGCKSAASADSLAIDLTSAICAPLENQPAGQPWVDFVCQIAQGVETVIASTQTGDAGAAVPMTSVHTVTIRVPASEAATFMAAHRNGAPLLPTPAPSK